MPDDDARAGQGNFCHICGDAVCHICGDAEPVHVHNGPDRIEDYFVVGRGETDLGAARRWKERALDAEERLETVREAVDDA